MKTQMEKQSQLHVPSDQLRHNEIQEDDESHHKKKVLVVANTKISNLTKTFKCRVLMLGEKVLSEISIKSAKLRIFNYAFKKTLHAFSIANVA